MATRYIRRLGNRRRKRIYCGGTSFCYIQGLKVLWLRAAAMSDACSITSSSSIYNTIFVRTYVLLPEILKGYKLILNMEKLALENRDDDLG